MSESRGTDLKVAWAMAALAVLVQVLTNSRYGYFRDELYYLAAGDHLAFGYVDFAPLIAWLARGSRLLFGDSLHAIRLLPALAFGGEVLITGAIARELGGKRWAMLLACLSVLVCPVVLANGGRLAMNALEPLFWMGCIWVLLLALNREQPRLLLGCGVLLGLGIENKHSTVFFLGALVAGLLATASGRRLIATRWFWMAAAVALLLALPNAIWQYQNHFPTLEDLRNVKALHKNVELPPLPFLWQQVMMLLPVTALVWIPGLGFLLFGRYRALGVTYLVFLAVIMALKGKDYYLAPIYPMLFAAGGVLWEQWTESRRGLRWVRFAVPAVVAALGVVAAPLVLPILPPERIAPYMEALGIKLARTENGMTGRLPQHFSDEFGWPEMVETVAGVYNSLPAAERAKTAILAGNYGEAGAIDFFGPRYGLPKAISAHQNYYLWGPRQYTGESIILLEWGPKSSQRWCRSVDVGPAIAPYYGMGSEYYNVRICHGLKKPLAEAWPEFKFWN
jgi:4-amino-4-deoxy-L-arabinose transferase-like glycosyltransferase